MKKTIFMVSAVIVVLIIIFFVYKKYFPQLHLLPEKFSEGPVLIESSGFNPSRIVIKEGTRLIWINKDTKEHMVTLDDPSGFKSEALKTEATFFHIFYNKGEFPYHCELNPSMKGTVIVK